MGGSGSDLLVFLALVGLLMLVLWCWFALVVGAPWYAGTQEYQ
jgi:hypothetical protein